MILQHIENSYKYILDLKISKLVIVAMLSGRAFQSLVADGKKECWKELTLVGTWKILSDDPWYHG